MVGQKIASVERLSSPMKTERLNAIRRHLYAHGPSTIQDLAEAVGTSLATLRRDLTTLEDEGIIDRVHGGARLAEGSTVEVAFEHRENHNLEAKRAIANTVFELLKPHTTVFFDASTTVLQLVRRLRIDPVPVTVFTNGLSVAQALLDVPRVRVMTLGGQVRNENASIIGPHAEAMLDRLWFDQLFLGAGAINQDGTIYSVDLAEASLNAKMLARSTDRHLLVDSSKFGTIATYAVAPVTAATHVISDSALPIEWRQRLQNLAVNLILASAEAGEAT
jgi:DeoR/GlpR family transcriptional regulator of sugar metabolism